MMAGSASDICKINIQLQTGSTEGETGNYGEIMKKGKKEEDEAEKMICIFCFVFCHRCSMPTWSLIHRRLSDIPAAANICHHNSWPLFWLVFKRLTRNYFWETIRGRTSWLPHSQTPENWESAALPWSGSLRVWASGLRCLGDIWSPGPTVCNTD